MNILIMLMALNYQAPLSIAKQQVENRDYEGALKTLSYSKNHNIEYFFYKGVAEFSLTLKNDAEKDISFVLNQQETPLRYKELAQLMCSEMSTWKGQDLGTVARKMQIASDRLVTSRAGPITQALQKQIVDDLDKEIKKLENKAQKEQKAQERHKEGAKPMSDSSTAIINSDGKIDYKRLGGVAKEWGSLPPKDRSKITADLTRNMPSRYRDVIEEYFRRSAKSQ